MEEGGSRVLAKNGKRGNQYSGSGSFGLRGVNYEFSKQEVQERD